WRTGAMGWPASCRWLSRNRPASAGCREDGSVAGGPPGGGDTPVPGQFPEERRNRAPGILLGPVRRSRRQSRDIWQDRLVGRAVIDTICEEASTAGGLDDFGDEWFLGPLAAWAEDLAQPNLTDFGRGFLR